jgi:outer membrane protein OmpA-like peptidoglycan-associated protein
MEYFAVFRYLLRQQYFEPIAQQGVPESSMTAKGLGKAQPIASNSTAEGRQQNRLVE